MPRRARGAIALLTAVMGVLAAIVTAAGAALPEPPRASPPSLLIALALLTAGEALIVRVRLRSEVMALSLFEAMLVPVLFRTPVELAVVLVIGAQVLAGAIHRIALRKVVFNVAQWALAAAVGGTILAAFSRGQEFDASGLAALAVTMTAIAAINVSAFSVLMHFLQHRPLLTVARNLLPSIGATWALNGSFAVLFVAASGLGARAIPFYVVPLLLLHWGSRGLSAAAADIERMHGMHTALRSLTGTPALNDVVPQFLATVRHTFDAAAAELVLTIDGRVLRHRLHHTYSVAEAPPDAISSLVLASDAVSADSSRPHPTSVALAKEGWRNCLAAPLSDADGNAGMLCVYDRSGHEGFEEGELAVLTALATEAAGALARTTLLERLLREQRTLADVVASTTDGIFAIDRQARVSMWNPGMEAITGQSAGEVVGGTITAALLPRDRDARAVMLEKGVGGADLPGDIQVRTRAGHTRWLSCSYTRLAATEHRAESLVVVARDITRQRELDTLKEDFVATVSHELRTPLTPIKGWAETLVRLGDRMTPGDRQSAAEAILRQAGGLERLISNLLEVAKIERGVIDLRDEVVDLRAIVADVMRQCHEVHPGRPILVDQSDRPVRARGDAVWIERIVCNLLSNAARYSPPDSPIEIVIREGDGAVEIAVSDTGVGIALSDHERIFDRFTRLGNHLTRETGGAGLGLYISRQLARGLGGSVDVRSELGSGSTFTLSLPGVRAPARTG